MQNQGKNNRKKIFSKREVTWRSKYLTCSAPGPTHFGFRVAEILVLAYCWYTQVRKHSTELES